MYLNTHQMSTLFGDLLSHIGQVTSFSHGYTLFVLNLPPKYAQITDKNSKNSKQKREVEVRYGYRHGFSQAEMTDIASDASTLRKMFDDMARETSMANDNTDEDSDYQVLPLSISPVSPLFISHLSFSTSKEESRCC